MESLTINPQQIRNLFHSGKPDYYHDFFKSADQGLPAYELGKSLFRTCHNSSIAGYDIDSFKSFEDFIEKVHPEDVEFLLSFAHESMKHIIKTLDYSDPPKAYTDVVFRMIGKDDRICHIRKHTIINGLKGNLPTHSVSYLEDVTWLKPSCQSWSLKSKASDSFVFETPKEKKFKALLSSREIDVLKLIVCGLNSEEIAEKLFLSPHTISTHRKNMIRKLGVSNTPQLVTIARDMQMI